MLKAPSEILEDETRSLTVAERIICHSLATEIVMASGDEISFDCLLIMIQYGSTGISDSFRLSSATDQEVVVDVVFISEE